ncbi:UbiD family decarboxylase [Chloroflexota bacterium]
MGKDLRQFLQMAREAGPDYYVEASKPLSPKYEVCVLQQKLAAEGRFPVLYCPQIEGSKLPLVSGLFGSYELLGLAMDIPPKKLREMGRSVILEEYMKRRHNLKPTKEVSAKEAPVQEVVLRGKDIDLGLLPIIHHYELNPTKYSTISMTLSRDPDTGVHNMGVYRQEVKGKNRIACMMTPLPKHGTYIANRYAELGKPMEVVAVIGHHPALGIASTGPHPLEEDELEVAGALLGEPLEVVRGVSVDLPVPAFAEIAIEGTIDPTYRETDGPFSETYGYYGSSKPCYVIEITAITMRKDAIYNNLDPRQAEHNLVSMLGREANLYNKVKSVLPTVKAVHFGPAGWAGQNFMYIAIDKRNPGDARLAGLAAILADRNRKAAVVVDEDIDIYNDQEVLWAIGNRVRGELDIITIPGLPVTPLHPTARAAAVDSTGFGQWVVDTKIIIDATEPEGFATRVNPPKDLWQSMKLEDYLK